MAASVSVRYHVTSSLRLEITRVSKAFRSASEALILSVADRDRA